MALSVTDYLIDVQGIDWPTTLSSWNWLLRSEFSIWIANRFGDLFLVQSDGTVHMLDVGGGTLTRIADSRDDFCARIDTGDNAAQWLMIPLVDRLVAAGMVLQPGQCYGFKIPPILCGDFTIENCCLVPVHDYLGACGRIHEQLRGVPDGTEVILKVTDDTN